MRAADLHREWPLAANVLTTGLFLAFGTQGAGEPGLSGVTVGNYRVVGAATNLLSTDVTDASGFYEFAGLASATNGTNYFIKVFYVIRFFIPLQSYFRPVNH
mgnify:CR=1 FL=1